MKVLIHDYGGYAFIVELSRRLAARGHQVIHLYAAHNPTPHGSLQILNSDPANLSIEGLDTGGALRKHRLVARWFEENRYGRLLQQKLQMIRPDVVISANTPLDALAQMQRGCHQLNTPFIYWVQDLIGQAMVSVLSRKLGLIGGLIGRIYLKQERRILEASQFAIFIAEGFKSYFELLGAAVPDSAVIPNWAPIDQIPVRSRENLWSNAHRLDGKLCFLYTGSLGMKHDISPLVWLADPALGPSVALAVVSQGPRAEELAWRIQADFGPRVRLIPLQPMDVYPEVLASADILVAILAEETARFSVPSKALSYLCAQRPILLAAPADNPAARLVADIGAGIVVDPSDRDGLFEAARRLINNPDLRGQMGRRGRQYAEETFDMEPITDRFEGILGGL